MVKKKQPPLDPAYLDRLRAVQEASGLSQEALGELIDRDKGTVNRIIAGTGGYSVAMMAKIASVLNRPVSDMLPPQEIGAHHHGADVPLIGVSFLRNIKPGMLNEFILAWGGPTVLARTERPGCFAIDVEDCSVERRVPVGSVAVIDPMSTQLEDGGIYLIAAPNADMALRVYRADGVPRLEGDSLSRVPPLFDLEATRIIGRAVQSYTVL